MTQPPPPQQSSQPAWAQQPPQQHPAGQPGSSQPGASAGPAPRRLNAFAVVALVVAMLLLLVNPVQQLAFTLTLGHDGGASFGAISTLFAVVRVILSLATVALGVVGLVVRDRERLLAAAAVGIGAWSLLGIALTFVAGLVTSGL